MTDQFTPPPAPETPLVNKTIRAVLGFLVLAFAAGTIVYLLKEGRPGNSLHDSAMSWSYLLILVMLVAFGLGNAIPSLVSLVQKRP